MTKRRSPWVFLGIILLLSVVAGGSMEYVRREEASRLATLTKQVSETTTKVTQMQNREAKLKADESARKELAGRLINLKQEELYSQLLMAMARAGRSSGVTLSNITFAADTSGQVVASLLTTQASGTEAQVLQFIRLLEEGSPAGWLEDLQWNVPMQKGGEESVGSATLKIKLYGPQLKAGEPKPPTAQQGSKSK